MTDLTPEEFDELVEMAVDETIEKAPPDASGTGKVTAPMLVVFLTKYHVNTTEGRQMAFSMLKEQGIKIYSNEGFAPIGAKNY